jgi:hypothetical protein
VTVTACAAAWQPVLLSKDLMVQQASRSPMVLGQLSTVLTYALVQRHHDGAAQFISAT